MAIKAPKARPTASQASALGNAPTLMGALSANSRGDSRATRTCRLSISTTREMVNDIDEAAHALRMNRSRFVEMCVTKELERMAGNS
jgi:hypothetical protein